MATLNERAQERIADLHGIVKQLERAASVAVQLEGDQQAFACDEIQTGRGAIESELEARSRSSRGFAPELLQFGLLHRLATSIALGVSMSSGRVEALLVMTPTEARRFVPQPSSCSRSIAATSSG